MSSSSSLDGTAEDHRQPKKNLCHNSSNPDMALWKTFEKWCQCKCACSCLRSGVGDIIFCEGTLQLFLYVQDWQLSLLAQEDDIGLELDSQDKHQTNLSVPSSHHSLDGLLSVLPTHISMTSACIQNTLSSITSASAVKKKCGSIIPTAQHPTRSFVK